MMRRKRLGRREPEFVDELAGDSLSPFAAVGLHEQGCRNLAAAVLYAACTAARKGDLSALDWINGREARRWAEALNIEGHMWPPSTRLLVGMQVLGRKRGRHPRRQG